MLLPLHGLCVHRTPSKVQGIRQCLIVGNSFIMTHIEAAVVAQNAGADIIFLIVHQLRHPFLVRQELSGESGTVDFSVCNGSRSCLRIHTSGAYHRDIHEFTDMRHILQIAVLRHIDRRMCPVPGIIGSVITVQHIITGILQILCCFFGFCHITACFCEAFSGKCSFAEALGLGFHTVTKGYREILSADFLDLFYDLCGETISVFKRTAVFIGTLIHVF